MAISSAAQAITNNYSSCWPSIVAQSVRERFSRPQEFVEKFMDAHKRRAGQQLVQLCFGLRDTRLTVERFVNLFKTNGHAKSRADSLRFRLEGNASFGRRRYKDALKLYSKCVMLAPAPAVDDLQSCLAIGYANRSAALYHLEQYQVCLEDISRAFAARCPLELQHKLLLRRSQCHLKLHNRKECIEAAEMCSSMLANDLSLAQKRKEQINLEILELIRCANVSCQLQEISRELDDHRPLNVDGGQHEGEPSMSALLQVKSSRHKGRHIVAKKEVKAGDTLFVEEAFASVLLEPFYETHCHNCYSKISAPIPCESCSQVGYCSSDCRDASWIKYHRIECGHLDLLHAIGLGHLICRIILMAGLKFLLDNKDNLRSELLDNNEDITSEIFKHVPHEGYFAVHSLVSNSEKTKPEDIFAYCLTACLLCKFLEPELRRLNADEKDVTFVGSLMVRHTCQVICNAHAITDLISSNSADELEALVDDETQERIATAIYPAVSLVNHSCQPNVIASFDKKTVVMRAVHDISEGDEIHHCYGPHFKRMSTRERKSILLEQYFFDCDCEHCNLDDCQDDVKSPNQDAFGKNFDIARRSFEKNDFTYALKVAKGCLELSHQNQTNLDRRNMAESHDLAKTYDLIARIHAEKGCYLECAENLHSSLIHVSNFYGCDSIELANEILKYVEAAMIALQKYDVDTDGNKLSVDVKKNLEFYKKANRFRSLISKETKRGIRIFTLNYGPNHKSTKHLLELQKDLKIFRKFIETLCGQ